MKHILCYGDSNTWGANPEGGGRFDENHRWTALLARDLGPDFFVIEEGLCGRTTVFPDRETAYRSGTEYIHPCLRSHKPLELIVLMFGTNDLKALFGQDASGIARGLETLVKMIQDPSEWSDSPPPQMLIVSPAPVRESIERSSFRESFGGMRAVQTSRELAPHFEAVAARNGCHFLDAARSAATSDADAIHLGAEGHANLSRALGAAIRAILP